MSKSRRLIPVLVTGAVATSAVPALAAGGGYGPGVPTGPTNAPGGYTSVVTAQTVGSGGGVVTGTVPGATVAVHVPAGSFSRAVIIEVTAPSLGGINAALSHLGFGHYTDITGAGVKVLNQNGTPYTGTFDHSLSVVMHGGGVSRGDVAIEFTSRTHAVRVPVTVSGRTATVRIGSDPDLAILKPKARHNPYKEPTSTVREGNRGAAVKWVQWALGVHVDGVFGSKTRAAVIAFQKRHHLTADGVVGAKTRSQLAKVTH